VKVTIDVDLPDTFLADVLTTAWEGGIDHWINTCDRVERDAELRVLRVTGLSLVGEDRDIDLDLTTVEKGIERVLSGTVKVSQDLVDQVTRAVIALAQGGDEAQHAAGEIDAGAADVIVQAGAFAEVMYG
jgi:hypothetical protein